MKIIFTMLLLAALITACATTDKVILDSTPRPPTTHVDVYKNEACSKPYKAIAELTFLGPREDELKAQRYFIKQAQALGGNGILFGIENAGVKGNGFGVNTTYVFQAKVISYNN